MASTVLGWFGLNYDRKSDATAAASATPATANADAGTTPTAPAPATASAPAPAVTAPATATAAPTHLFVLCHGLHGAPSDLAYLASEIRGALPAGDAVTLCVNPVPGTSGWSNFWATHAGLQALAERALREVTEFAARYPSVNKLSIVGHSLGGVYARLLAYLLSVQSPAAKGGSTLWRRTTKCAFITVASPNLGSRQLTRLYSETLTHFAASTFLQDTGKQLMLLDAEGRLPAPTAIAATTTVAANGSSSDTKADAKGSASASTVAVPLLVQMCCDEAHLSALRAFRSLYCYANVSGDTSVHYSTAAITTFNPYQKFEAKDLVFEKGYENYVVDRSRFRVIWDHHNAGHSATNPLTAVAASASTATTTTTARPPSPELCVCGQPLNKPGAAKAANAGAAKIGAGEEVDGPSVGCEWEPDRWPEAMAAVLPSPSKPSAGSGGAGATHAARKLPKTFSPAAVKTTLAKGGADSKAAHAVAAVAPTGSAAAAAAAASASPNDYLRHMYLSLSSLPWRRVDVLGRALLAHTDIVVRSLLWNDYGRPVVRHIVTNLRSAHRVAVAAEAAAQANGPVAAVSSPAAAVDKPREEAKVADATPSAKSAAGSGANPVVVTSAAAPTN